MGADYFSSHSDRGKLWRLKYRFERKGKTSRPWAYPEISLADARERRDIARKQLANGIDPASVKKAQRQAATEETETFEVVAREWHSNSHLHGLFPCGYDHRGWSGIFSLGLESAPYQRSKPLIIGGTSPGRKPGGLESAHRIRIIAGQVFRYAVATGRAERDPPAILRRTRNTNGKASCSDNRP